MVVAVALASSLALLAPQLGSTWTAAARRCDGITMVQHSTRRALLTGGVAATASIFANVPAPGHASYALYQSSYDSFQDRKATGYVPVATSDVDTLAQIQKDIARKRPQNANKPTKAPQYCAGQTASVTPMLENVCANIGVSKADQSNTMLDEFGNMNIGVFAEKSRLANAAPPFRS